MMSYDQLSLSRMRRFGLTLMLPTALLGVFGFPTQLQTAGAQKAQISGQGQPLYIHCIEQRYDAKMQIATCSRDVELSYPSREIQATAAQAQYFFRERRIILSGNVYVLQQGHNSIKAEEVIYLIDEGRFIATPKPGGQVQSIYIVNDKNSE